MPARPMQVCELPPMATARRDISMQPRVIRLAEALSPRPMAPAMPLAMATMFLAAAQTSTPITSVVV